MRMPDTLHEHALFAGGPVLSGVYELDADIEPHAHDFVEIAVVGTGQGVHVTTDGERVLQLGDLIILRPGAWHAFTRCSGLTVANCCLSAQSLRAELAPLRDIALFRRLLWLDPRAAESHGVTTTSVSDSAAHEAISEISRLAASSADRRRPGLTVGRLVTVLGILADGLAAASPAAPPIHPVVVATIGKLEAAPEHQWRLTELAEAVNLDPSYLGRLFRRYLGLSPLDYLARLRAELAAGMLAGSQASASSVGAAVGWPDPTYFARRFRTLVGLTPTEYRRRANRHSLA